jgi:gamma-aminobutyric acid type B receptor
MSLLVVLLVCLATPLARSAPTVTVGGLFPITGGFGSAGVERRAAAQIAIDAFNADPTVGIGLNFSLDSHDTQVAALAGVQETLDMAQSDLTAHPKVFGIVGAAASSVSMASNLIASLYKIPQISYSSTSPELSDKGRYPYFLRVVPPDSVQGVALAALMKHYEWTKCVVVHSDDSYGRGGAEIFVAEARKLGISITNRLDFARDSTDFSSILDTIKEDDARIIIMNMLAKDAANLLREAEAEGMISPDRAWIATDGVMQTALFQGSSGQSQSELVRASDGMVGTRPRSARVDDPLYVTFLDTWAQRGRDRSNVNFYAPYAYDATTTLLHSLDRVLDRKNVSLVDGSTILADLVANTSFSGLTGSVTFNPTTFDRSGTYDIVNIQYGEIKVIGEWTEASGVKILTKAIWHEGSTDIPKDSPDAVILRLEPAALWFCVVLGLIGLTVCIALVLFLFVQREAPVFRDNNPMFLGVIVEGCAIGFGAVIAWTLSQHPDADADAACVSVVWLLSLSATVTLSALVLKVYQINQLFNNVFKLHEKRTLRLLVKTPILVGFAGVLVVVDAIVLALYTAISPPGDQVTVLTDSEDSVSATKNEVHQCSIGEGEAAPVFVTLLVLSKVLLLGYGFVTLIRIRKVLKTFNDGRWVNFSLFSLVFVAAVAVPTSAVMTPDLYVAKLIVGAMAIWIGCAIVLGFMFIPKILLWYQVRYQERVYDEVDAEEALAAHDADEKDQKKPKKMVSAGTQTARRRRKTSDKTSSSHSSTSSDSSKSGPNEDSRDIAIEIQEMREDQHVTSESSSEGDSISSWRRDDSGDPTSASASASEASTLTEESLSHSEDSSATERSSGRSSSYS